jgi:hypothetical protein
MAVRTTHERDALRADRRWLLAWAAAFTASIVLLVGVWGVYRVTGPHPQIRTFIRRLKHEARWLIPFLKRRPAKWYSHQEPLRDSGHAAQRAYARSGGTGASSPASRSSVWAVQSGSPMTLHQHPPMASTGWNVSLWMA